VRSIHFHSDQMVWECQTNTLWASDRVPKFLAEPPRRQPLCPMNIGTSGQQRKEPTLLWLNTVNEYADRRRTVASDVFPAISGLARAVHSLSTSKMAYAAGIWLEDWRRGILWACGGYVTKRTSGQYIAPSWSWGSLEFERSSVEAYWTAYQTHKFSWWWCPYGRIL
jgi:hypothetical protein